MFFLENFFFLSDLLLGAIGYGRKGAYQFIVLVVYLHLYVGYLMVVECLGSHRRQRISLMSTLQEGDAALQTEGEQSSVVHHGSQREIRQGEDGSSLTDTTCIQMVVCYRHHGLGTSFAYHGQLRTHLGCEYIPFVQKLFDIHNYFVSAKIVF